jgi:PIN domain nuclease of toxin-antitoxin system
VNLLVDTHILLWWLANDSRLSSLHRNEIADPDNLVYVSAASAWEIAIKQRLGKLSAPSDLASALTVSELETLPITIDHALTAGGLPMHHRDPFDRMLVAQSQCEKLTILTEDPSFEAYRIPTM